MTDAAPKSFTIGDQILIGVVALLVVGTAAFCGFVAHSLGASDPSPIAQLSFATFLLTVAGYLRGYAIKFDRRHPAVLQRWVASMRG